ncbi:LysR family transcriptional regulator [Acinetobacter sp. MB5]|uniref:LysR family transcriptional regulator n=1 Tax=Acinetobacter sp. MB5 TaxID=2069438 RepID=UPI00148B7843|nr:LysR family transcriptional regulator [Acinetobacter sp. MB5]
MLIAVIEKGSFAKAAELRFTSVAQASKLIARLENELGVQLLHRSTRALRTTEIGQAYYLQVKQLMAEFDELEVSVKNQSLTPSGRIKISAPSSFGVNQLSHALVEFAQLYPEIELDVSFTDRLVNVIDEGFDLAIRIGLLEDSNLIARHLLDIQIMLVASPSYLQQTNLPEHPQDLLQHQCIIDRNFKEPELWRFYHVEQPSQREAVQVHGRISFANTEACNTAALAGLGICRIPSFICEPSLKAQKLIPVMPNYRIQSSGLYAMYPPSRHLANKIRCLIDFLKKYFEDRAWG